MKKIKTYIGLRTLKTTAAVIIAMMIVQLYGTSPSKLIFAMLGAMAAVQPTFRESIEVCLSEIIGVVFGAVIGIILSLFRLHPLVETGIGIILIITLYNGLRIRYSPSLPCFILVMLCTSPDVIPMEYALGRIWDTAIGLSVGLIINMLVFPYDNSRQIRANLERMNKELIAFLEDTFDGDDQLPSPEQMIRLNNILKNQLRIFSNQKLPLRIRRQKKELERFQACEKKTEILLAHMEILYSQEILGRLSDVNRRSLTDIGALIRDERVLDTPTSYDVITNYHLMHILELRQELLDSI